MSSSSSNETMSAAGGIDVNALVRIHDRLQSTSDESLPPILVNIIAKIIPLTNQDDLRTKAVEVITESLRRAKAIKCSFPLEVFVPLVQSRMLPFACNFGIAFLDAMSDLNCVTNINTENIISLLDAIASYNLHIYQSNAVLYFALLYSDRLTEALLSHPQQDKLLDIVGDYFLDFILLQHLNLDNVAGSIQPGLSEKRVLRLKQKKKQFAAVSTKVLKQQVLDALFGKPFIDTVYATLLCLIASADADKDVAAKGKQVLNRMKDDASYVSLPFGLSLLSCTFNFDFDKMKFGKLDRTNYRLDVQIVIVEYLVQQFAKFSKFHVDKVSLFVYLMVQQLTANGSRSETTDRLLVSLLELMRLVLLQDPSRGISLTLSKIIMRLCKAFLPQFVNFSTSVVVDHQHGIRLRGVCYELIQLVLDNQQQELCQDIEALVLLFQVAEKDELSGSTILFKVLNNLREVVDIKDFQQRSALLPSLQKLRVSQRASCRLVYLQWMQKVDLWTETVLQTMVSYTDDIVEIVSNYAKRQFKELEKYLFQCNQQEIQVLVIALARVYVQDPNDKQITKGGRLGVKELRKCITLCFLRLNHLTSGNLSLLESLQHLLIAKVQSIGSIVSFINEELHDQLIDCTLKSICANENEKELKLKESFRYLDEGWCNWGSYLQDINAYSAKYNEIETIDEDAEILFCTIKYSSAKLTEERIKQYLSLLEMPRRTVVYSTIASLLWTMIKITELDERLALMQMWNTSENVNILLLASAVHLFPPTSTVYQTNVTLVLNNALALLRSESNLTDDIRILERTISITNALEAISIIAKHCSSEELETVQALLVSMLYRKSESSFTAVLRTYSYVSSTLGKEDAALDVLLANSITANLDQGSSFALGECIVKLCSHLKQRDSSALTTSFTRTIETLISKAAVLGIDQTTAIVADKIHHCTILVVFVKNMNQLVDFISFKHIDNMLAIFLAFLRSNDGYLQDLSSLGLCYLYQACEHLNTDPRVDGSQGLGRYKSVQDYLAQEIANVVTRRKRPLQPAGYDPSGRGSSTNNADAANTTETNNTTNTTQMDETIRAVLNEAGNQRDEVLEAAAAMAATELNSAMGEANRSSNLSHLDPAENGYGAYSKVCSIARKGGDSVIVIVVVSLVKCDPTFGQNKSYLTSLQYTMPIFAFDKNRVHALIPFMYMAKFDPVTSVREIIQSMWEKFVGSEEGLFVKENEQKIIEYLSSNMLNPSWREREAACIALDAILLNKQWFVMKSHMGGLISKGLKVMDDLRESTRKVATNLMKMFFQNILRASNPTESDAETCQTTISMILPILLEKGIVAASVEARGFSLGMLLKLIEQASHMMVPWLIKLIDVFLESISALEPQMLNYIQFHTQSLQMGGEDWEKARLQLSNHTPMHQGLRSCLNLANIDQIPLVCNVAFFHLQSGVGLATRVAAADTLADMAERYPTSMGAHSGKALHSIGIILLERPHLEKSLKKAMLNAFGMLSKVIHVELLVDECFFLLQKYLDHSNKFDDHELAVASCILEVTKRSGDRIQHVQLWNQILSIAYLGSFDAAPEVSKVWSDTFTAALDSSGAGTKLSAIHRCTESLAQYVPYLILDQSWDKRKQAVRVITEMTNNLSAKDISQSYGLIVLSLLLTVPGSLWNGQNQILDALADICKKCPACLSDVEFNSQLNDVGEVIITTSSKDVLKFHVPLVLLLPKDSGYDLEQVKLMQDQIRSSMQDLSRMSDEISDSIVGNAVHWRLNPAILLDLVKIEINRGDLDYRISAANLLASLPWENILSLHPHFLNREFPYLIDLADLHPKAVVSESQSSSTSSSSPGSITAANLVTKKTNNNASFLFGNRYGSVAAPPKPRKTISISSASPSSSSSTAVVSNDEPKVLVESEVGGKDRNLGVTSPAFRMFVVDTIVRCCRVDNVDMSELCNHLDELLQAITEIMKVDAWSMKRSCLQLVSSVASKASLNTAAHLNAVISILEIGASDPKHVKVKVAALEALRTTMQGVNKSVLISSYDERIKVMIRSASLDTQPSILEEASKLQALLLNW